MRKSGTPTRYPGIFRVDDNTHRVRAKAIDPRTGKTKEIDRLLNGVSAREASVMRAAMIKEALGPAADAQRMRVGEFAQSWMKSKKLKLDPATATTYADALDKHILPALGDYYYDAITPMDVQKWIDDAIRTGWRTQLTDEQRWYSPYTVRVWFRVFRTMTRDALVMLALPRDPTLRVTIPDAPERDEANALTPEQLAVFLTAMQNKFPQHYAMVITLAYTGLRWCHASALRWEDYDEEAGVLRIQRKHVRGEVGPVSRKKRAPKEYPVEPELKEILLWHRHRMMRKQAPGFSDGWMFPSQTGTPRAPSSLDKAWGKCLEAAKIEKRFTVHGLRYTFTDLVRRANVDAVVRRALTGHVTEEMQRRYSTVQLDEKRAAIAGVIKLVRPSVVGTVATTSASSREVGTQVGTPPETQKAG
jgi:integrase